MSAAGSALLLVEPYDDDVVLTKRAFDRYGIDNEIVVARSGPEALQVLRGGLRPLVVMVETALPGLSGADLATAIRADQRLAKVPMIMLLSGANERAVCPTDAVTTTLMKPIVFGPLVEAMEHFGFRFADGSSRNGTWLRTFA